MTEWEGFAKVDEKDITRAIVGRFAEQFSDYADSDCIVVGAGPAGLALARQVAAAGFKTLVVERNNYLGGGFWIGGYLMNKLTVRAPAHRELDELGVPYEQAAPGLYVADAPHACSKLIAAACDAGVKFANMTVFEDLVIGEDKAVRGVVVNWSPVSALPRQITCVDPVALTARVVVDATGHDASVVSKLSEHGLLEMGRTGPMQVSRSEDLVVEHSGPVYPGVVVAGMAVSTTYGLPRMGPTFGAMLLSGKKGARAVLELLGAGAEEPSVPAAAAAR